MEQRTTMGHSRVLAGAEPTAADLLVTVDDLMAAAARVIEAHSTRSSGLGVAVRQMETALDQTRNARSNVTRVVQLLKRAEIALRVVRS